MALGAYGRRQLTPRSEVDVLFLCTGEPTTADITERVCLPLWEQAIHVEPLVRTPEASLADMRRSWSATTRFLDAHLVCGDASLWQPIEARVQAVRRDRERLRHRLRNETEHRHASHPSATSSSTPDLVSGRGGLLDIQALRWLDVPDHASTLRALDFLLASISDIEDTRGQVVHRLSAQHIGQREAGFLEELFGHARWVAFSLDSVLAPDREDRTLGATLAVRFNRLVAERPPPLERVPSLGLRVANLVGLAPPSPELLDWASTEGPPLAWEDSTLGQFWLMLRAADWRAWDFLDVTGLLTRFLPELQAIRRRPGSLSTGEVAVDTHVFHALRRLHGESDDALVKRAWRAARHRDLVYLAVLLHELDADAVASVARRLRLSDAMGEALQFAADNYAVVLETATRRDLHDEDLVLELATRVGNRQRLGMLFLVALAHEMSLGGTAWSAWQADLVRQLFGSLDIALRQPIQTGVRQTRGLEQRRERIVRLLYRRNLPGLVRQVARLPRRYVLSRSPEMAARHLTLLQRGPLDEGEVRIKVSRHREARLWDLLVVAHDRPGLLATLAGVLALRGASVLGADAATASDGLVLDVFNVHSAQPLQSAQIEADLDLAIQGRIPLHDLLGSRPIAPEEAEATHVSIDNAVSAVFNVVEVRAPDQVGLLYRIASALLAEQLDIQHARIATHPDGALDVFYVRDLSGNKLDAPAAERVASSIRARLTAERPDG